MKLYDCKVRVMGDVRDEVRKYGVTQAEITVLRRIHGDDAVSEISVAGDTDRSEHDERDRLNGSYGAKTIDKIFGVPVSRISDEAPPTFADVEDKTGLASLPTATRTPVGRRPREKTSPVPDIVAAAATPADPSIGTLTE